MAESNSMELESPGTNPDKNEDVIATETSVENSDLTAIEVLENVNRQVSHCDSENLALSVNSSLKDMAYLVKSDEIFSSDTYEFSSIWILLRNCKLLTYQDLEILLPNDGNNLIFSKTYTVNMHFTTSILDHYSKEINRLLCNDDSLKTLINSIIIAQISCLPDGSQVTFYVVKQEHYNIWITKNNDSSNDLTSVSEVSDMKELLNELQYVKNLVIEIQKKLMESALKYAESFQTNSKQTAGIEADFYMTKIESACEMLKKINDDLLNKQLKDLNDSINESQVSIKSLVQCNNLLIAENADLCCKYEHLKSKVQYPDLDPNEDLLMVSDNRLINSNERLRVRLTTMQNNVEELEDKLHRFEKQNSLLSEQILKMKLQMDLKKFNVNENTSDCVTEKSEIEIMKNSDVMKKVAEAGKVLLEDIKSIENLLRGLGKYVDISEEVIVNGTDELPELMDTCRRCIIQLSKTVLAAHNKAEKSESYINEMKIQNDDLTLESTVLIRQIDDLKEKLTIKNCEKTHLLNIISKLSEENSVIQEQVSQSSYRNILLNEQLHKLWKHHTLAEGGLELEELFNKSKGNENNANLWNQIDELVDEKYKLLEKVNQAELRIQKIQGKLDKSEQLLVKTSEDYENYIIKLKTESDEKIAKLKDCHETLKKNIISTQKENISLIEQVETLRKKNCVLLSNQLERDNEIKKLLHEVTLLKESVENISLCLSEEKSKNYEMKQKLEQINNIQEILNGEETDIDEGAMNVNTTKTGQNDMLNYGILKNNWLKQSKKIETLEKSLKESEKKYEEYVKQSNEALNETEQELNMTKNRLTEYESHVSVLDIELKRQVSMMDKNIEAALNEKRELEKKLSVYNYELCNLTETFNLQSKKFLNLNEKFKISYENCNTAEQALAELEMKYESIKQSLVEKENIIQNLEKGNKEIEQMVAVYNKAVSDLEEEQRKVDKLEGKIMSLEAINNDLESKLREKEDLLQSSLNNLMSVKEELAELNAFFQENSKELQKLESLHNSDKVDFEFNLKKCLDEKKAIEKSFAVLSDEKEKLQKEYDMLCDKLVGAVRTLMENKLDRENMETHIKELNETVSELQKEKDNNEDQNHLLKNVIENTKCVVGILQKDKNLMKELNSSELQLKLQKKSSTEFKMSLNKKVKSIQKALVSLEEKFKREKHVYAKNLKIKDIQLEEKEKSLKVANDHIDGLQILLHKTHNHLIIKRQECHKLQVDILRIESEKQTVVSRVQELECQLKNALA